MKVGDVITVKSFTHEFSNSEGKGCVSYAARLKEAGRKKKGEPTHVFRLVLLGRDTIEEPMDVNAVLESLGWTFSE